MFKFINHGAIKRLADIRQESADEVRKRFSMRERALAPRTFSPYIKSMYDLPVAKSGVRNGLPYVQLENGRIFYGHMPAASHRRQYQYVKDRLPQTICEDAFLVALDVAVRYVHAQPWPPSEMEPPKDGLIVECGAYLGHKAIAFFDKLVPQGRVIAIEMIPENVEILKRNVTENGLTNHISIVPVGVWHTDESLKIYSKGWQKNSLVDIGRLDASAVEVPVRRVESIMSELGLSETPIDLIYVTVNGAEFDALDGLGRCLDTLKAAFVVSPYKVEGKSNNARCRSFLDEHGIKVFDSGREDHITAKR